MNEKFKNFVLSVINEDENTDGLGIYNAQPQHGWIGNNSSDVDLNDLFNVHRVDIVERLNVFVQSINKQTYVNPTTAVSRLRDRLGIVGLAIPVMPVNEGVARLRIAQYGGVYDFMNGRIDDLISEKLGYGLDLALKVTNYGGRYAVQAKIITTKDAHPFDGSVARVVEETDYTHAKNIGNRIGIDWNKVDLKEFAMGLQVEKEHADVTKGDDIATAKIALAHLRELPDYYSKLQKMES